MKAALLPSALVCLSLLAAFPAMAEDAAGAAAAAGTQAATPAGASGAASAQATIQSGTGRGIPKDISETWSVAFAAFSSENLSAENAYLAFSLPLLIKGGLGTLPPHTFKPEELAARRKSILSQTIASVEKDISKLQGERDELLFTGASTTDLDVKIASSRERLDFLSALDPALIELKKEKGILVKEGKGAGNLFDAPQSSAGQFCAQEGVDMLVGGTVREVQGYLLLDVWAYDAALSDYIFSYREVGQREEIYGYLSGLSRELIGRFLGREWAALSFVPDPPQCTLYVDDKALASGRAGPLYLDPGRKSIRVSAPGHVETSQVLDLPPQGNVTLTVKLEKTATAQVTVTSDPPGADIYLDSVWKGRTPLQLAKPAGRSRGTLALQGYFDKPFELGERSPETITFSLLPARESREEKEKKAREGFYTAFGWFVTSLAVPLLGYGGALNYAEQTQQLLNAGYASEALAAQAIGNVFYGTYIGGIVVSAGIFTWMIFTIIDYVSVVGGAAG